MSKMMTSHLSTPIPLFAAWYRRKMRVKAKIAEKSKKRRSSAHSIAPVLLGVLAGTTHLASQQAPPKQEPPTDTGFVLRQTVRRVRVDVVVTDRKGHPVKGLKSSDFKVAEDGEPQAIRQFEWRGEDYVPVALPNRPALLPRTFINIPAAPKRGPLTVLLYDVLNTPLQDQPTARAQMLEFLKKNRGRRIAIFLLGDRLRLLQGFTQDTDLVERAANNRRTMPQSSTYLFSNTSQLDILNELVAEAASNSNSRAGGGAPSTLRHAAEMEANAETEYASYQLDRRVEITLDALAEIGRFLSGVPGRKNLLWFSGSFPATIFPDPDKSPIKLGPESVVQDDAQRNYGERMRKTTNLLNTAEVALYPIDARGLQTNSALSASGGLPGARPDALKATQSFFSQSTSEFATMDDLSEQTGGRAFYKTNGLEEALEKAANDGSSYYSLVYAPTSTRFDGKLRRISVHLPNGHYHLAYRRSYFADDVDSPAHAKAPAEAASNVDSMEAASEFGAPSVHDLIFAAHVEPIGKPAPATAEQLVSLAPYLKQAANVEHKKLEAPPAPVMMRLYTIVYDVLAGQLDLLQSPDTKYHSDLSFAAMAFDDDGETLWGTKTEMKDSIPITQIDDIRKDGFKAVQAIVVPASTAVIRLAVRDEDSGRIGSMEIRLPLPSDQQETAHSN